MGYCKIKCYPLDQESMILHSKMGCFNPSLGQIWTNSSHWVKCLNYIFNPTFGFVHILPTFELKQPSMF